MTITYVRLTGTFLDPETGTALHGTIKVRGSTRFSDPSADRLYEPYRSLVQVVAGEILDPDDDSVGVRLPASVDATHDPDSWTYDLEIKVGGYRVTRTIELDAAGPSTVDLADIADVVASSGVTTYATQAGLAAETSRAEAVEADLQDQIDAGGGGSGAPDATATVKGKLKLAGDLGGTADLPTVPGLAALQPLDADLTTIAALDSTTAGALTTDGAGWIRKTYAQLKTALGLVKGDVGLGNVDNTSDASKPISTATQTALDGKETAGAAAAAQAFAIQRANHTGTQTASTISDFATAVAATPPAGHGTSHLPGGTDALTTATAGASAVGDSAATGSAASFARSDHRHSREAFAIAGSSAVGDAAAAGSASTVSHSDHVHGREAFASPGSSAVADSVSAGAATTVARSDHRHGREAFGAVTAQTSYGSSSADGTATTVAHSDHVHGTPSLTSSAATTSAVGDSAAVGVGTTAARSDHTHGREAFAIAGSSAVGDSAATGSAATISRSDHKHGREAFGAVTAQTTFAASSTNGVATTIARSDHAHGTPTHDGTAHSAISLSSLSAPTADLAIGTHKLTGVSNGTVSTDAAAFGQIIPVTIIDAKGDLILGTAADTAARYAVGSDGYMLAATSDTTPGVEWIDLPAMLGLLNSGQESMLRREAWSDSIASASGNLRLGYFTARKTFTMTALRMMTGSTAAGATPTLVKLAAFSVAGNGDLTRIAVTTSDTTLFAGSYSVYTRNTIASASITRGTRYAVGALVVTGATAPTLRGYDGVSGTEAALAPRLVGVVTGLTDIASSYTNAQVTDTSAIPYVGIAP